MDFKVYKEKDYRVSRWTGGTTKQLAIFPEKAKYLERNFIWRLSTATCQQEETTFTRLADFDRVLMVLEGNVVLAHQDVRVARLGELEQDRFDGAYQTKGFGKITDYNLMIAKGNLGALDVVEPEETSRNLICEEHGEYDRRDVTLFCRDGFATVTINGKTVMLSQGDQMVINSINGEELNLSVMGEGHLVRGQIFYNYRPEELGPTVIPRESVRFTDFKTCVFLANTQFRGARFIFKKLKTTWYDEELSKAIRKIERIYLPFFVFILGLAVVAGIGVNSFSSGLQWVTAVAAWFIVDCLVVSPLMYLVMVPKPVDKHIKDINNLTPYEEKVLARELETNERLDRIMKKYKTTGRMQYDEEGNRIDKTF